MKIFLKIRRIAKILRFRVRLTKLIYSGLFIASVVTVLGLASIYMASSKLVSIDYQVYGKVQGVFFRKFTKSKAESLGLVGWVKNTKEGTVTGTLQGPEDKVKTMRKWLQTEGSPKSKITKCDFTNEHPITDVEHRDFRVIK